MGGWDYYCFLCAAGFHPSGLDDDEDVAASDEEVSDPNPKVLFPKDMVEARLEWLSKFRTIGLNRNATGLTQCYLTGPATGDDYGQADIEFGEHPNAQNLPNDYVSCYRNGDEENGDLPVHDSCFAILCKVFARAQGTDYDWEDGKTDVKFPFDLDALFSSVARTREDYASYLKLDHTLEPDQYFFMEWDRIYDYFDPLHSPDTYTTGVVDPHTTNTTPEHDTPSLFDSLPLELLTQILDLLPQADLVSLIKASKVVHRATRPDKFWQRRLVLDAPWLWEHHGTSDPQNIRWQSLYNNVMMQTLRPFQVAKRGAHVSGLANRKRIWRVCEQVLQMYLESNTLGRRTENLTAFEEGVVCRYLPIVATLQGPQFTSMTVFFFDAPSDMHLAKHLILRWTDKGALGGMSFKIGAKEVTLGDIGRPGVTKFETLLDIEPGDWIESLVLNISVDETWKQVLPHANEVKTHHHLAVTGVAVRMLSGAVAVLGKDDGYKRLLEPLPGNGIVGLKTHLAKGRVTHLGLLEHPVALTKLRSAKDAKLLDLLWDDKLPSSELRYKDYYSGYWMGETGWDLVPMKVLLFGSTDIEQSTMTGFGASANLECLEIYRSDGSCEQVGAYDGPMKVFYLDGPGGERISGFDVTIGALPVGITLVTTYGRQVVFGRRKDNNRHAQTSEHGFGVAGIYCSFAYNSMGKDELSSFSLILSPHIQRPPMDDDRFLDVNGLVWEPRPPPPSWHPVGPVYGPGNQGEAAVCIDLSRPVSKIDGLFPAPEWLDEIEIGGFSIHYSDGNPLEPLSHLGFSPPQWPTGANATPESLKAMRRHHRMSTGGRDQVDTGKAHVLTDEDALRQPTTWSLEGGGEKIIAVTVWAGDYLHGLQFHAGGGQDSPRWGKCGGEPSGTIHAGGMERIVGLKVIMGSKRLNFNASTYSPQAVQAMGHAP